MDARQFIDNYREAFGDNAGLPITFWYADRAIADPEKVNGCLFKVFAQVREGRKVSFDNETITCGGGRFYTGFDEMPERVPNFVSIKERYKKTPEMVIESISRLQVPRTDRKYLNFSRIDQADALDMAEGVVFFATPDILSGLVTWTCFDNNSDDAVTALFGSGCSAIVTRAIIENRRNGRRAFIGLFDPSARPHFEEDILSYAIPMSRFREMCLTMRESCLFGTQAWGRIRERIVKRGQNPADFC